MGIAKEVSEKLNAIVEYEGVCTQCGAEIKTGKGVCTACSEKNKDYSNQTKKRKSSNLKTLFIPGYGRSGIKVRKRPLT
jgi:hypothetical protein